VQTLAEQRARRRHREQWERDHLDLAPMRQTRCDVCEGERGWEKAETIPNEAGGSVYAIRWEHCPACAGSGQRTIRL
jgi:NAD-dependent dihydropyrimidine dehydrogenase PreA subunit